MNVKEGRLRKMLLALVSALVMLLVGEIGLRLAGCRPELQQAWYLTNEHRVVDEHVIMIRPELRDARTYARGEEELQVVAIGDSLTEGFPVFGDRTYPAALERHLRSRGVRAKVVNAGLGNSGPGQHLRLLQTYVLPRTDPDVVVWQLYGNDLWDNVAYAVSSLSESGELVPRSGKRHWIHFRQRLYDLTPLPDSVKRGSYLFNLILKGAERFGGLNVPEEYEADPLSYGALKLARQLEAAERLAREHDFDLLVVLIPPQSSYLFGAAGEEDWTAFGHRRIRRVLESWGDHLEISFTDADLASIRDEFGSGAPPPDLGGLYVGAAADPNPLGRRHLNEFGYWLVARKVGERVLATAR